MRDLESWKTLFSFFAQIYQSTEIELKICKRLEEEKARRARLMERDPESEAAQHAESLVNCLQELLAEAESMTNEISSLLTHVLSQLPKKDDQPPQKNE